MATKKTLLEVIIDPTGAKKGASESSKAYGKFRKSVTKDVDRIEKAFSALSKSLISITKSSLSTMRSMWSLSISAISAMFTRLGNAYKKVTSSMVSMTVHLGSAILKTIGNAINSTVKRLGGLLKILGPVGLLGIINKVVEAGIKLQKFSIAFSVITGDVKSANNELQSMIDFAKRLGLAFDAAAAPFAKFFAAARNALTAADIRKIYESFAEVSVALHLNKQEVTGVFLALQQIASKGRVSMEELRLQLAERVPGAMRLAAESMGMSMEVFEDAVRRGTINASEFLINFGKILHREFGPAAERASKSMQATLNRLGTSFLLFLGKIANSGVMTSFANLLTTIEMKFLNNGKAAQLMGKALSSVLDKLNEYIKNINSQALQDGLVFILNFFVKTYNVIIDLIPQIETVVSTASKMGKVVKSVMDYFDESTKIKRARIRELRDEISKVEKALPLMASDFGIFDSSGKIDTQSEAFKSWAIAVELTEKRLSKLKAELKSLEEITTDNESKKLKPFTRDDLDFGSTNVGDSSKTKDAYNEDELLANIKGFIGDAEFKIKEFESSAKVYMDAVAVSRDLMEQSEAKLIELKAKAIDESLGISDRLIAAKSLLSATDEYLSRKEEFLKLSRERYQQEIDGLRSFTTETVSGMTDYLSFGGDLLTQDLEYKKQLIRSAADQNVMEKSRANELIEVLELKHQERLGNIIASAKLKQRMLEQKSMQQRVKTAADEMVQMTNAGAKSSKKLFEINKAAKLAQAVLNTPSAVSSAYAVGAAMGGPIVGAAFGAIALANQLAMIQQIKSTTFNSSSASGTTPSASNPGVDPIPPMSDALFNATDKGQQENTIDSSSPDSPINVSFEINAVDAKGVDELIVGRQDLIIGMIQSAYNERGKSGGPLG